MPHRNNMICCICESKCHFGAGQFEFYKKFGGNLLMASWLDQDVALQQQRRNIAAIEP
jgi:hypothetical protein